MRASPLASAIGPLPRKISQPVTRFSTPASPYSDTRFGKPHPLPLEKWCSQSAGDIFNADRIVGEQEVHNPFGVIWVGRPP